MKDEINIQDMHALYIDDQTEAMDLKKQITHEPVQRPTILSREKPANNASWQHSAEEFE